MTQGTWITDEELTSYLDGEASDPLRRRIDATLNSDAEVGARLERLTLDVAALRAKVRAAIPPAPDMPQLPTPQARGRGMGVFAAGLAAGVAIGAFGFASFFAPVAPQEGWASFVASYQKLYTADTLNAVDQSPSETSAQLTRLSDAIGLDLNMLPQVDGLTLKRAQILGFRGRPLVQIAYQRPDGTPVALCIILSASQDPLAMTEGESRGLQTVRWNTDRHGFLLIGAVDQAPLTRAAEVFAAAL